MTTVGTSRSGSSSGVWLPVVAYMYWAVGYWVSVGRVLPLSCVHSMSKWVSVSRVPDSDVPTVVEG